MGRIIFVEGNIIAYKGNHVAKNLVALAGNDYKDKAIEVIEGDLNLYKNGQMIPYYTYAASKGITAAGGSLGLIHAPTNVLDIYKEEIEKIKRISSLQIPNNLQSTLYRQLFVGVIGALELSITEFFTCLILGDEYYYREFINKTDYKISLKDLDLGGATLDKAIYDVIHNLNTHRLDKIKVLIKDVFDINMPNYTDLGRYIKLRHDLVHRCGNCVGNRSLKYVDITKDTLTKLIHICDEFVDEFMVAFEKPIEHWDSN